MKRIVLFSLIIIVSFFSLYCQITDTLRTGTFIDVRDGEEYKWVTIGNQTWMGENLDYDTKEGSCCYLNEIANCYLYGRLYTWNTAINACPSGWHLPSDEEWTILTDYLGSEAAVSLMHTIHWRYTEAETYIATNSSRFSALPGGMGFNNGKFNYKSERAEFWSSTERSSTKARYFKLTYAIGLVYRQSTNKDNSLSVRCIKDPVNSQ